MSRMNANILLASQGPNIGGAIARGQQLAAQRNQIAQQNALSQLYNDQGPAIAAGDQNALNELSRFDPQASLGIQETRQGMQIRDEQLQMARQQAALTAKKWAATVSAQEAQAEAEKMRNGMIMADRALQAGNMEAYQQAFAAMGEQAPPPEMFPGIAATVEGAVEGIMSARSLSAGPKPLSGPGKIQADIEAGVLPEGTSLQSPQVVVNTGDPIDPRPTAGKVPSGFQRRWDEENQTFVDEPIPGSEPATEADSAAKKGNLALADYDRKFTIVDRNLDKAISQLQDKGRLVAGVGSVLSAIPESAAKDFQATLDTIKANLGFEELQAMRDSSPTGGALGQVTEREIAFLQAIQGNLDAAQSPEQLLTILQDLQEGRTMFRRQRMRALNKQGTSEVPEGIDPEDWKFMPEDLKELWVNE